MRITPAFRSWLEPFRCDAATYAAIAQATAEMSSALSFEDERPIVWQTVSHERYGVIARADMDTFYAIPHDAELPA